MFKVRADLTGKRFGMLVVHSHNSCVNGRAKWNCVCDCGGTSTPSTQGLRSGNSTSCGCKTRIGAGNSNRQHSMSGTRTYKAWRNMKMRCTYKNNSAYKNYGGRGISFDARWSAFVSFLEDMGKCPDGLELDRIDNDKNYSKENCRWATLEQQVRNRRVTLKFNGVPLIEIAEKTGMNYDTLFYRLKKHGTPFPSHLEKP